MVIKYNEEKDTSIQNHTNDKIQNELIRNINHTETCYNSSRQPNSIDYRNAASTIDLVIIKTNFINI